jgi:hypothetical protein
MRLDMRIRLIGAAAIWLAAFPVWAQSPKDVRGPWTLTSTIVMCTDVPVATKPAPVLTVKGIHNYDLKLMATSGPLVIGRRPDDGLAVGQRYILARVKSQPEGFPRPGEGFGDLRITGVATIKALDEVNAMADIDVACDGIEAGDYLAPYTETVMPDSAAPVVVDPDFTDRGNVLFGVDNRTLLGTGDVLSIDRGTQQGTAPGARYAVYRDRRNGMPLIYLGEMVVLSVGEQTSKVVITKTVDGVEPGDIVVPRRAPSK